MMTEFALIQMWEPKPGMRRALFITFLHQLTAYPMFPGEWFIY